MSRREYADIWEHRMNSGLKANSCAVTLPICFTLRKRLTDGFTRVEVITGCDVRVVNTYGESQFHFYATDEDRRKIAAAFLEGLPS